MKGDNHYVKLFADYSFANAFATHSKSDGKNKIATNPYDIKQMERLSSNKWIGCHTTNGEAVIQQMERLSYNKWIGCHTTNGEAVIQ